MVVDRYRAVGLAGNPFAHGEPEGRGVFIDRGFESPPGPGATTMVQVIGDKGYGKTTHLRWWRQQQPGPWHYVPRSPYRGRWARPPLAPMVYIDEADRMPASVRYLWLRRLVAVSATAVVGTHADLSAAAERAGFRVVTHWLGPLDRDVLERFVSARIANESIEEDSCALTFTAEELSAVCDKAAGSLRRAETLCHEVVAAKVRG